MKTTNKFSLYEKYKKGVMLMELMKLKWHFQIVHFSSFSLTFANFSRILFLLLSSVSLNWSIKCNKKVLYSVLHFIAIAKIWRDINQFWQIEKCICSQVVNISCYCYVFIPLFFFYYYFRSLFSLSQQYALHAM